MDDIISSTSAQTTVTQNSKSSTLSKTDQLAIYYVTDNSHIVIPLISFVFGFPILVIVILCLVQQRNKCYYKKQQQLRLQNQRLSTVSTLHSGLNSTRSLPYERDRANSTFSAARLSVCNGVLNGDIQNADKYVVKSNYIQRRSLDPVYMKSLEPANVNDYTKIVDEEKIQQNIFDNHSTNTNNNGAEKLILLNV